MFRNKSVTLLLFGLILLASCSKYKTLLKSNNYELKLEKAIEYYNKTDYYKAMQLLEELVPYYRGTQNSEKVNYYYAYCYYRMGDNILASYYFKRFAIEFPNSKYAEECFYMNAYTKYLDSPIYTLDQTSSYEANKELQLFINYYPQSDSLERCNELIDKLRYKLQKKDFEISRLYYKTENYLAAITSFKNVLKDYPDTKFKEEILFLIVKTYYYYAFNSIRKKQTERYSNTINAYREFAAAFPESTFLKEANGYYENSLNELKILSEQPIKNK